MFPGLHRRPVCATGPAASRRTASASDAFCLRRFERGNQFVLRIRSLPYPEVPSVCATGPSDSRHKVFHDFRPFAFAFKHGAPGGYNRRCLNNVSGSSSPAAFAPRRPTLRGARFPASGHLPSDVRVSLRQLFQCVHRLRVPHFPPVCATRPKLRDAQLPLPANCLRNFKGNNPDCAACGVWPDYPHPIPCVVSKEPR